MRFKQSHDWPLAFATVVLTMNGNTFASARVVLGAVAPVPWRSPAAEQALVGKPLTTQTAAAAADAAVSDAKPMSGNAYKIQIAKTAVAPLPSCRPRDCRRRDGVATVDPIRLRPNPDGRRALPEPAPQGHVRHVRAPDPDEFTFYDKYDGTAYGVSRPSAGFGPDGNPVRPDCCSAERDCCKH